MPTRLLFDLGGTVNSSGVATVGGGAGQQQPASSWSLAIITASLASGSGSWTIELVRSQGASGTILGATFGDTVQSGPYLLAPGEMLQASVSGATAGTGIVGSVYGTQNLTSSNLPPISAVPSQSQIVNATISGPVPVQNVTNGQLETRVNAVATITEAASAGSTTVTVNSAALFAVADPVFITTDVGANQQTTGLYYVDGLTSNTLSFEQGLVYAASVGDVVVLVPTVQSEIINSPDSPVVVEVTNAPDNPLQTASAEFNWYASEDFGPSTYPSITYTPTAASTVNYIKIALQNTGADSTSAGFHLLIGGTQVWSTKVGVAGVAGTTSTDEGSTISFVVGADVEVNLTTTGTISATTYASLSMAGYTQP